MKPLFHALKTKDGVPVYLDQLPSIVTPAAVSLFVMSGGADDIDVGEPGIHHWGEHLPFRGTVGFPERNEVMRRIAHLGGRLNASTSPFRTRYYATAPRENWVTALEIVVDLAARPLNRPEDIEAERQIIGEEIREYDSRQGSCFGRSLRSALWGGHRMAMPILGTHESLARMDLHAIERMREHSYGRERCVLFVSGAIEPHEALAEAERFLEHMPQRGISERRVSPEYDPPSWKSGCQVVDSTFEGSTVALVFPYPDRADRVLRENANDLLLGLFATGSLSSPLQRVVREERTLTYGAGTTSFDYGNGGYFGFVADTSRNKVDAVVQAFWDVVRLPEVRSKERREEVSHMARARHAMRVMNPLSRLVDMEDALLNTGLLTDEESRFETALAVPPEEAYALLDTMTPENACTFIYRGTK